MAWDNRGDYVTIDIFEVDGTNTESGTLWDLGIYAAGWFDVVENNLVHNIAQNLGSTGHGAASIEYRQLGCTTTSSPTLSATSVRQLQI
jgi:hypothetical protein